MHQKSTFWRLSITSITPSITHETSMNKGKVIDVIDVIDVFQLFGFFAWGSVTSPEAFCHPQYRFPVPACLRDGGPENRISFPHF